jgi:hypothetical protein
MATKRQASKKATGSKSAKKLSKARKVEAVRNLTLYMKY